MIGLIFYIQTKAHKTKLIQDFYELINNRKTYEREKKVRSQQRLFYEEELAVLPFAPKINENAIQLISNPEHKKRFLSQRHHSLSLLNLKKDLIKKRE